MIQNKLHKRVYVDTKLYSFHMAILAMVGGGAQGFSDA